MFKKIIFGLLILINTYFLYGAIGFSVMGANCPKLIGDTSAIFMGNYVLAFVFGIAFVVATIIIILLGINIFKKKKV